MGLLASIPMYIGPELELQYIINSSIYVYKDNAGKLVRLSYSKAKAQHENFWNKYHGYGGK